MSINSIVDFTLAAASCPGVQDLILTSALILSLLVGYLNSRKIRRISETPALKDHLKKRK